jgi:pullulanase
VVPASQLSYGGQPVGYTAAPIEAVNYCSVHDNQTLFDAIQLKSAIPGTTDSGGDDIATRARRQVLAMSLIALGQGVPFFLAGDDLLRSKDMDNNSYDSGDWFNKIDFTYESANWGIGLPIASQNQSDWPFMQPLLADPALTPTHENINHTRHAFSEFLRIRESSLLFRMATLAEVQNNLHFLNTGPSQTPGLIVMKLDANGGSYGPYGHVVVVFNGTLATVNFQNGALESLGLHLHSVQADSRDETVRTAGVNDSTGTLTVPGLTTAVFVSERP